ncbi:hypothetical protein [Hydrogenophaga sp.]|uniref:hypothetical protein n=1 Tax=Hydrogenophaga sp. TaxID=1904254 RepID=UPI003F6AB636
MRTTLSIEDDVLYAAKSLARREGRTLGEVISDLARRSLQAPALDAAASGRSHNALDEQLAALGLTPYRAPGVAVVTQAQVDDLREAEGI